MKKSELFDPTKPIPSGSQWQKILLEIYLYAPHQYGYKVDMQQNSADHPLARKLGITGYELMLGVSFLLDQEMISERVVDGTTLETYWILEKKGFDVALDLKKFAADQTKQNALIYFTIIVALTGVFQLFAQLQVVANWIIFSLYVVTILIVVHVLIDFKAQLKRIFK